jgi:hypothetical protein
MLYVTLIAACVLAFGVGTLATKGIEWWCRR